MYLSVVLCIVCGLRLLWVCPSFISKGLSQSRFYLKKIQANGIKLTYRQNKAVMVNLQN